MSWNQIEGKAQNLKERVLGKTTLLSVVAVVAGLSALASARAEPTSTQLVVAVPIPVASVAAAPALRAPQPPVYLGNATWLTILAKSGVSTTGTTKVKGHIGVSPIQSTGITGFGLTVDASGLFSTSSLVAGLIVAPDYSLLTQTFLTLAVGAMQTAYTDAAGRTLPDFTELGAGNIGGMTLAPGLYKWGTAVVIPSNGVVLTGSSTDVWIFQIAQGLTVRNGAKVTLAGGARADNVFWQVAGQTTLGTTADFSGNILCQTAIVLKTGAKLTGRALAQTAVTLDSNAVSTF